tara:strand:+ start:23 stop:253 length:231 start_codon:yes stop_codon:yes gene_type:complete
MVLKDEVLEDGFSRSGMCIYSNNLFSFRILIVLIDWILGGFLIGIGLVAIIFYFTWDFAGFLDNSTNKIRKWSRDE